MIVSKEKIDKVADKMVEPLESQQEELRNKMGENITNFLNEKVIPKEIQEVFIKYPEVFEKQSSTYLNYGRNYFYIVIDTVKVQEFLGKDSVRLQDLPEVKKILLNDYTNYCDLQDKKIELRNKIKCVLSKLRTYSKVSKELPDAYRVLLEVDKSLEKESMCDSIESLQASIQSIKGK